MTQFEHIDTWKHAEHAFEAQLKVNKQELEQGHLPTHWRKFLQYLFTIKSAHPDETFRVVDLGCGIGTYGKLVQLFNDSHDWADTQYIGYDYAPRAIDIAKREWNDVDICTFEVSDYKDITKENIQENDIVHACSLHNVLPDGDDCLHHFFQLESPFIIFGKLLLTDSDSEYTIYTAYDIETYLYKHNFDNFIKMADEYGYDVGGFEQQDGECQTLLCSKRR